MNQHPEVPVSITSAKPGRSTDIAKRQSRYLMSMAIRTICFVGAVVTDGPLRWILVAGAVFLPYVAVVLANATDQRGEGSGPARFIQDERPALEGPVETASPDSRP